MGQQSRVYSTLDEVSRILTEVVMSNTSNCGAAATSIQRIKLENISGDLNINDINYDSSQTVNLNCLQSSDNNTDIVNDLKSEITRSIRNKLDGQNLGLQSADTVDITRTVNEVTNMINIDNIKNCIINAINTQEITVGNVQGDANIKNINFKSAQNVVQECIQNDSNSASAVARLDRKIQSSLDNTVTGFISSSGFIIIMIVIVVVILLLVFLKMSRKSKNTD
jgi:hypothetical protein